MSPQQLCYDTVLFISSWLGAFLCTCHWIRKFFLLNAAHILMLSFEFLKFLFNCCSSIFFLFWPFQLSVSLNHCTVHCSQHIKHDFMQRFLCIKHHLNIYKVSDCRIKQYETSLMRSVNLIKHISISMCQLINNLWILIKDRNCI